MKSNHVKIVKIRAGKPFRKMRILNAYGWKCFFCETPLTLLTMTEDHLRPRSKGGSDKVENIVPACATCNMRKGNKMPWQFTRELRAEKDMTMDRKKILHAWAMRYLAMGWNVLPANAKHPLVSWKPYQERRVRVTEWDEWLHDPSIDFNQIALVTGRLSGVTVLDIDIPKDGSEYKDPDWIVAQFPDGKPLVSRTGRGGRHVFFAFEDIPNSVKVAHPQLDVRSEGGIIILPPSIHENGQPYEWEEVIEVVPREHPRFPTLLSAGLEKRPVKDWQKILRAGAPEGRRTDSLVSVIGKFLFVAPDIPEMALDVALVWNRKCSPPLPEEEVRRTWSSMVLKDRSNRSPRSMDEF